MGCCVLIHHMNVAQSKCPSLTNDTVDDDRKTRSSPPDLYYIEGENWHASYLSVLKLLVKY